MRRFGHPSKRPAQNTRSVILSPDAELNFVSFATLLGEDDQFLAEKYSLRYVSSGRDLLRTPAKASSPPQNSIALYGNPDFLHAQAATPRPPSQALEPLGGTRAAEIRDFREIKLPPLRARRPNARPLRK